MSTRFEQRRSEYEKAVQALEEVALLLQEYASGDQRLQKALRDSLIQRFEFCYELAWKTLKLWLESKDIEARNAKDVLREALAQGILSDGSGWTILHENRNLTSHTYDEAQAEQIAVFALEKGLNLFRELQATLKRLSGS